MTGSSELTQKRCEPCEGKGNPFNRQEAQKMLSQIPGWQIHENGKMIFREFNMKNFMAAVKFINQIAEIAEADNHHPDIHLTGYRKLKIELSTHAIGGLSENDFIVAAKINTLPVELKK